MCANTSKKHKFLLFSLNKFADKVCTFWQWNVATEVCKLSKIPRTLFQKACCFRCMSVPAPKSFLTLVFEDVSTFSFLWQSTSISLIDFVLSTLSPHLVSWNQDCNEKNSRDKRLLSNQHTKGCNLCSWMGKFETSRLVYVCGVVAVVYMRRCVCGSCGVLYMALCLWNCIGGNCVCGSCVCGVVYVAVVELWEADRGDQLTGTHTGRGSGTHQLFTEFLFFAFSTKFESFDLRSRTISMFYLSPLNWSKSDCFKLA